MKNKCKLLFVVEAMGGGVFTYIVDLANELIKTYDVYIAYAVRPQTPMDYKSYFDMRIKLIQLENWERNIRFGNELKTFIELRKIAKQLKPDIIHLHSSKAGVLGRLAFNGHTPLLFYTPHGYSFLMENCSTIKRFIFYLIERLTAKRRCTTISCSQGEHKESLKITKRAAYVNNGINYTKLDDLLSNVSVKKHSFTVFTLGRLCHQKNPELFNKIALAMPDVRFVWIGDGELRSQITAPNIEVTGWVDRSAALQLSLNADAFILTSLWEGLPMSLLEAMYMKKPCIVSDVIGNHDVIQTGINGFVCQTINEFVNAIRACQQKCVDELVNNAYQDIISEYNTQVVANGYRKIYESAIDAMK